MRRPDGIFVAPFEQGEIGADAVTSLPAGMVVRGGSGAAQASGQKVRGRYGAATDRLDAIAAQAIDQARHLPSAFQW